MVPIHKSIDKETRFLSRKEAEQENITYWKSKSPEERLSILQDLREQYIRLFEKEKEDYEAREGL